MVHDSGRAPTPDQRARRVFALLVLACLTVITLDAQSTSPLDPLRSAVGNVVGPMETATATALRPFTDMPVTGVPLPLVSYGGSSIFASLVAVGLLLNIQRRSAQAPSSRLPAERVLGR